MKVHKRNYDVTVVGAGIVGLCVAHALVQRGFCVLVVEKGYLCSGTSGSCNGNIIAGNRVHDERATAARCSIEEYLRFRSELGLDFELRQYGSLSILEDETQIEKGSRLVREATESNVDLRLLDGKDLRSAAPFLAEHIPAAIFCPTDISVNPLSFCAALAKSILQQGGEIHYYEEVVRIQASRNKGFRIVSTERSYATEKVINCAGINALPMATVVRERISVQPNRGHILVVERPVIPVQYAVTDWADIDEERTDMHKSLLGETADSHRRDRGGETLGLPGAKTDARVRINFVIDPTCSGNILVGKSQEPGVVSDGVSLEVIRSIARRAIEVIPQFERASVIRAYTGIRPESPDGKPIIGQSPSIEGYYYAVGHGGDGITLAPCTGKLLGEIVADESTCSLSQVFSPVRFDEDIIEKQNQGR